MWRPHLLQGWTTDFIPKLTSDALNAGYVHETVPTSGFDAIQCSKDLAQKEGIFTGISGGGTFSIALQARTSLFATLVFLSPFLSFSDADT
jgi:cysteine synthase A